MTDDIFWLTQLFACIQIIPPFGLQVVGTVREYYRSWKWEYSTYPFCFTLNNQYSRTASEPFLLVTSVDSHSFAFTAHVVPRLCCVARCDQHVLFASPSITRSSASSLLTSAPGFFSPCYFSCRFIIAHLSRNCFCHFNSYVGSALTCIFANLFTGFVLLPHCFVTSA